MKKKLIAAALLTLSSGLAQAQDMDKPGWYGGLDLGYTRLGLSSGDVDGALANQGIAGTSTLDTSDKSFGINRGYPFNPKFSPQPPHQKLGRYTHNSHNSVEPTNGKFHDQ